MTFLVVHQSTAEAMVVEYADRAGAEAAALFLANTQGGSTRVFAAFELLGYVRARDVDVVLESHEEALPVCPNCGQVAARGRLPQRVHAPRLRDERGRGRAWLSTSSS